jgi:ribosome-binding factor A
MSRRLERLGTLLRQELSDLVRRELHDPRLAQFITITRVDVSPDLQYARVYVSVLGSQEEKEATLEALRSASAFLRYHLVQRLVVKRVPSLQFRLDDSLERGDRLLRLIDEVAQQGPG